ncbi:MAG: hypothetical protein DWQ34_28685 [Planctomycetota bacterium]|nr:MAG: hypothetical protein DWQ29_21000 [Planctomycetota bacterium]REJ85587.1 MAG: hypothetical protein DWQ34_28685 [Planctomycetota bacterium]REK26049.1 MAG: hypothetical protein DWQ41_10340 [Planctomycetota bacterium]REK31873.1 MAG: hypothetical protein DWQ45_18250 [Planctomycetota bacterium]
MYILALGGSFVAIWLWHGPPFPPFHWFLGAMLLSGFFLLVPFVMAGLGVWLTGRIIKKWHLRRPVVGTLCVLLLPAAGSLGCMELLQLLS